MTAELTDTEIEADTDTETEAVNDRGNQVEFVHFQLEETVYELELGRVTQIVRNPGVTQIPQTRPAIAGVANLNGDMAIVVDGRTLFNLPPRPTDADTVLLLLDCGTAQPVGLLVDAVPGIDLHEIEVITPPGEVDTWEPPVEAQWFCAVIEDSHRTDHPVGVIDPDAIMTELTVES